MTKKIGFIFLLLFSGYARCQTFPVTGQLPTTAFPVCGTKSFQQSFVPIGATHNLTVPGCPDVYPDTNPFWYVFTCYQAGTLGFVITPNKRADDYDWMLYDITGHNPDDVFTNASLIVTGNWSGSSGLTGARNGGANVIECASDPRVYEQTFSSMPTLKVGHKYLLMVSHYTQTQSGYALTFGGGTAVITDPTNPHLQSVVVPCDRNSVTVILNKQMQCKSLAPDGSDFVITSFTGTIRGATGFHCNSGFDMDSIQLSLDTTLSPGNYSLVMQTGSDGNTLLDDCGAEVPIGETISFSVLPPHPTPLDSLTPPVCAPGVLVLVFADPIRCQSIAADGSDFVLSGMPGLSVIKASGNCNGGLTRSIVLQLNSPIVVGGNFQVSLNTGTDGNTIVNECGVETPPGASLFFSTKDTVSAAFNYTTSLGCLSDTINTRYLLNNGVNESIWNVDSTFVSSLVAPALIENVFGMKSVQHIVTNGFCSDTVSVSVNLDNTLKASFQAPGEVCPKDLVAFSNNSVGNIISWNWDFGDGSSSAQQTPQTHLFPDTWTGKTYIVSLTVQNNLHCQDTFSLHIVKLQSCFITVPNAFTPNGDGKNDYLYPLNAFMAKDLEFRVYNRYGQLVFMTRDWTQKWDGTINGKPQETGAYVWTLRYTDGPSGKQFFLKGSSVLIR